MSTPSPDYSSRYALIVSGLAKPGQDIIDELTPEKADLWHCGTGVSGESGELVDAIKKHVIYGRELDRNNVIEELGDLEFYMERIRQLLNIDRAETIVANIDKLAIRYPDYRYNNQAAICRADKLKGKNNE